MIKVEIDRDKGIVSVEARGNAIEIGSELSMINEKIINGLDEEIRVVTALSICDCIKALCLPKEEQTEKKDDEFKKALDDVLDSILETIKKERGDK